MKTVQLTLDEIDLIKRSLAFRKAELTQNMISYHDQPNIDEQISQWRQSALMIDEITEKLDAAHV